MRFRLHYITLFIFFAAWSFAQDILVKKDSSRLEVKLLEVRQTEIKYKLFNYQEGPDIIISKNDIAYVVHQNGTKEVINTATTETQGSFQYSNPIVRQGDTTTSKKLTQPRVGDYIKFNLETGIVLNNSFANVPNNVPYSGRYTDTEEFLSSDKKRCVGFTGGINFLFGKSPYCKHVIGINYIQSNSQFRNNYYTGDYSDFAIETSKITKAEYKTTVHFINISNGLRFSIGQKWHIENNIAINIPVATKNIINGTVTEEHYSKIPNSSGTSYNNTLVSSETTSISVVNNKAKTGVTVSFNPKISYEFNLKNQKVGIFYSYNVAFKYSLPWHVIGILYYPFKKLR